MGNLKKINTREDLARYLEIPLHRLTYVLYKRGVNSYYESFEIPKRNGGTRQINAPTGTLKDIQKILSKKLRTIQESYIKNKEVRVNVSHGFEKKKGIITNASVHRNKKFVVNMDFENFFDSFHFGRVRGYFEKNRYFPFSLETATIIAQLTCYEGKLPQGAPTSPIITNLICNILDMRLLSVGRRFKVDYTRYVDDLTFSTNDKYFLEKLEDFYKAIESEVNQFGLSINNKKTRLLCKDSRQEVTGIIVNRKLNVNREYCKHTRSMAHHLYTEGGYLINGEQGTIEQLEGRFAYINQLDKYNNILEIASGKKKLNGIHHIKGLSSREKQYQKFLVYKYFFANSKPLIVTEGKTDIIYLRAALKKEYARYPKLIEKKDNKFVYKISFLRRSKRLRYFLNFNLDGADTITKLYDFIMGKGEGMDYTKYFIKRCDSKPVNPVVLIFDNEQLTNKRPLKKFINRIPLIDESALKKKLSVNIISNLYLLTNPLVSGKKECEIEDLFEDSVLSHELNGKKFSRKKTDPNKYYGKAAFAEYVSKNYQSISFTNFIPMLDELNEVIEDYSRSKGSK